MQVNNVEVQLESFAIEMPSTIQAGPTQFNVINTSNLTHNIAISGQGISESFDEVLQPGESKSMQVNLAAGEYRVWCPVGNHAERGMEMTLLVE